MLQANCKRTYKNYLLHLIKGQNMVVAVYNNKGGVGKTSLVAHVGFRAMELQKEITVVDADSQYNTMDWLTNGQWDMNTTLSRGTITITTDVREIDDSDFSIIDCPPAFEVVQNYPKVNVWIVPVSGRFSVSGAMNVIQQVKTHSNNSRIVLVANMVDVRTTFGKTEFEEINKLGLELFKYPIPRHDVIGKAEMSCVSAWHIPYGIRSTTAVNLRLFTDWVISGCNEKGVYRG
jgi:cellulose biosynthesis protein BcsQ